MHAESDARNDMRAFSRPALVHDIDGHYLVSDAIAIFLFINKIGIAVIIT